MPDREAIRSNAKYLRNVRPLDPEEISEYVEGGPHPAVVRQVLREEAVDLGIVERDDGTFVPVEEGSIDPPRLPITEFPEEHASRLEELLTDAYGPDWHEGDSGDDLREAIRELKEAYHQGWSVTYDGETAALAYAIYHLPDYYAAIQYVLAELAEVGLLGRQVGDDEAVDVLDGAAVGVGDPEHVLEASVAAVGVISVPDDARVYLAGEFRAAFCDDLDDVLGPLLAHRRRRRVLVVRDPDVRGLHAAESDGPPEQLRRVVLALDRRRRGEEGPHEGPVVSALGHACPVRAWVEVDRMNIDGDRLSRRSPRRASAVPPAARRRPR